MENKASELEVMVFEALGEVSMCWSETPKGVFQDQEAKIIGDNLVKKILLLTQPNINK